MKYILIISLLLIFSITSFHKNVMINDEPLVLDELNQSNDSLIANIISDSSDWSYTRSRWSKPHGKGWMKAYSNGIRFKYQNKWNKAK